MTDAKQSQPKRKLEETEDKEQQEEPKAPRIVLTRADKRRLFLLERLRNNVTKLLLDTHHFVTCRDSNGRVCEVAFCLTPEKCKPETPFHIQISDVEMKDSSQVSFKLTSTIGLSVQNLRYLADHEDAFDTRELPDQKSPVMDKRVYLERISQREHGDYQYRALVWLGEDRVMSLQCFVNRMDMVYADNGTLL